MGEKNQRKPNSQRCGMHRKPKSDGWVRTQKDELKTNCRSSSHSAALGCALGHARQDVPERRATKRKQNSEGEARKTAQTSGATNAQCARAAQNVSVCGGAALQAVSVSARAARLRVPPTLDLLPRRPPFFTPSRASLRPAATSAPPARCGRPSGSRRASQPRRRGSPARGSPPRRRSGSRAPCR